MRHLPTGPRALLVGAGLLTSGLLAAISPTPVRAGDAARRGDLQVAQATPRPGSLTVLVLAVPESGKKPDPAAQAIVRLVGNIELEERTNDKGIAKLLGIPTEMVKLRVLVLGAPVCDLPDLVVANARNRVVQVQVERWAGGRCTSQLIE